MLTASVSNLDMYRIWREDDELDVGWLLNRILGKEPPSEDMLAGRAFGSALEHSSVAELGVLAYGNYRFDFNCEAQVILPTVFELSVQKQYGNLLVSGRCDGITGKTVVDYKTTSQFDADRYFAGYQWRFYLDMLEADTFTWQVFVIAKFGRGTQPGLPGIMNCYEVRQVHELTQIRYPGMHEDCENLAREYAEFMKGITDAQKEVCHENQL